jgi:hypothetical protein
MRTHLHSMLDVRRWAACSRKLSELGVSDFRPQKTSNTARRTSNVERIGEPERTQ